MAFFKNKVMGEKGLGVKRNINLTTDEGLWNFYRGISKEELILIKQGKYSVLDKFFTTNKERAESYSNVNTIIHIRYQVAFGLKEQLRIFNRLYKNKEEFFDIICDRNLSFIIRIKGLDFEITETNTTPVILISNQRYEMVDIINDVLNERKNM